MRVPADALLGGEGQAFAIAQTRLGGGRIHHAMRTIGMAQKALDMMCERALSRETQGSLLADKQFVQGYIADSYAQLVQFRLFVLYTAWSIDKHNDYRKVRKDIATVEGASCPTVLHDIAWRAMQVHGALGVSNEMPFSAMMLGAGIMGLADGPTEVHKVTVARQVLRDYKPSDDVWPTQHIPKLRAAARAKLAELPRARGGEPVIDLDRLVPWMDDNGLPGKGEPIEQRYVSGGVAERDLRDPPRRSARRPADPSDHRARRRDEGIIREWRIIEALDGTDVPHTPAIAACADPAVLGRTFYLMGFVDGWSPMDQGRTGRRPSTPTSRPRAGLAFQLAEGIALLSKVDWRAKGLEDLGRPDGFHERQVDRWTAFLERIKGRELPGLRSRVRLAADAPADRLRPRAHARRLPVRQRDVPPRRAGPTRRDRRLGDGHRRRSQARPRLGSPGLAGGHHRGRRVGRTST